MSDTGLTARKIEQILRAGGVSKSMAREIIAHGFKAAAGQDDAGDEAEAVAALTESYRAAAARLKGNTNG